MRVEKFFEEHGIEMGVEFVGFKPHFYGETTSRNVYKVTLERDGEVYEFNFGASFHNPEEPSKEDILSLIDFELFDDVYDFTNNFGSYNCEDKDKAIFELVNEERRNFNRLFGDIEQEIYDFQNKHL